MCLLKECNAFDLIISSKKLCSFVVFYRSPSQSQGDFAIFSDNFEMTLDLDSKKNAFLLLVLVDFNAKLSQWHDKDSSTSEGISIDYIMSQFGLHQIINEPIHIFENSSSCIDLILLRNLIYQSSQELSPHSALTVTIRLFMPNLILKSFTHHLTLKRFGTINIQILILSDDPLNLTRIELLQINM